jgi:tetratricopeptide (TPR) repeat protein
VLALAAHGEWNRGSIDRALALAHGALRDGIVESTLYPLAPHTATVVFEMAAGHSARALEFANSTRSELETVDNPYAVAAFLSSVSNFEAMAGQLDVARADAERALEIGRRLQNGEVVAAALHGLARALQRDDPAGALAAAEEFLDLYHEFGVGSGFSSAALSLAGGLRARSGDDAGALELLQEAVVVARDQGVRPQLPAALDWSLSPLLRLGRADVAATFLGALTQGALRDIGAWPGVADARARALERARTVLADPTDEHCHRGATMGYDELIEYAIRNLDPGT